MTIIAILGLMLGFVVYWRSRQLKVNLEKHEAEMNHKIYELAVLKELGERIGYSLNIQNIVDIISGSLHQFIEYSVVAYMLFEPEKIIFKAHVEISVSRKFIDDIKTRMLKALSALLNKELKISEVEEVLSGAILLEELEEPVRSFFNIPLVIGEEVVGVLTIAHTKSGLYKEEEMTILYKIVLQASRAVTKLQEVVKTEQRKLNAMVESMTEGVVMTDKEFRLMVVNPALRKALALEEKKDLSFFDIVDILKDKLDIREKLEESIKLDKILQTSEVLIKDRFFQILISPVKSSLGMTRGEIFGGVIIFHDITQEKEIARMREDFTSMMVHELRAPLDGIRKITESMIKGGINQRVYDEYTRMIFNGSSEMLELVNDLLDVAKLESGKFELQIGRADIRGIVNDRLSFFKIAAQNAQLALTAHFDPKLPETVDCDPRRTAQVLNNLISNALKFTKAGGEITIQALYHQAGQNLEQEAKRADIKWLLTSSELDVANLLNSVIVAVTDTGVGIARSKLAELFNKFKQFEAVTAKEEYKGTGLGLVIAKGIVEAHKGIIGATSKEGVGSSFYFAIPINQ